MSMAKNEAKAAVALIEWEQAGVHRILVLQRAEHPDDPWSGHLAFPGGRWESCDDDLLHTCIREVQEECGFVLELGQKVEALPIASAGHSHGNSIWVQPWHFFLKSEPVIHLDASEMQRYFWVDKREFMMPGNHGYFEPVPGKKMPCIFLQGIPLWGFTYAVLMQWLQAS